MNTNTKMEHMGATWNPAVGCTEKSEGCKNCYARSQVSRGLYKGWVTKDGAPLVRDGRWTRQVRLYPERLGQPLHRRKPTRIFPFSMSDIFHPAIPFEFVAAVFGVMAATPQHFYHVLTKRPVRMRQWFEWIVTAGRRSDGCMIADLSHYAMEAGGSLPANILMAGAPWGPSTWPLPNVMLMVTTENQPNANGRIEELFKSPASSYGLSCEPLLGPINLAGNFLMGDISWVICGAEQGKGKRPMDLDWARDLQLQCETFNVPFFFKRDSKRRRELDGRILEQYPEVR